MSTVGPGLPPLSPTRQELRALAGQGNPIPDFAELAADLDAPLSAFTAQGKALLANFLAPTPVAAPA